MTTRKGLRIIVWIVLIAIAGLTVISYTHPLHTRISRNESRMYVVSISDGNLRIVHLFAEPNANHMQDSPLEKYADRWTDAPTKALTWRRNHQLIYFKETPISDMAVGCSLFVPLGIVLAFLLLCDLRRHRQLADAIRESIRPSNQHTVRPFRRVLRRSVVVIFGMATLLVIGNWVTSYTGPSTKYYIRAFDQCTLSMHLGGGGGGGRVAETFLGDGPYGDPYFSIATYEGKIGVYYMSRIVKGTIVPTHDFQLGGFRWHQRSMDPRFGNVGIEFPCWALVLLFSAWPIIAFVRGPYRRAGRRAKGFCLQCGYNLTGLVEPRCPECGCAVQSLEKGDCV